MTQRLATIESHVVPARVGYGDVTEELCGVPCAIEGEVPGWVDGKVYRQAGGAFMGPESTLLDGLGHVAMWEVKKGNVFFTNKFLDTAAWRVWKETGTKSWTGTVKSSSNVGKMEAKYKAIREKATSRMNPNVNFWVLEGDQVAATSEFPQGECILIDPTTLESLKTIKPIPGSIPFDKKNGLVFTTPAHFFKDPSRDADYHLSSYLRFVDSKGKVETGYKLFKGRSLAAGKQFECAETVPLMTFKWDERGKTPNGDKDLPGYMHSLGESEKYVVGLVPSKKLRFERLGRGDLGFFQLYTMGDCDIEFVVFDKQAGGRFVGRVTCPGVRGMMFHTAACYTPHSSTNLVNIITTYSSVDAFNKVPGSNPPTQGLMEFSLNLSTLTATSRLISPTIIEFPTVNPLYLEKSPKYVYGVGTLPPPTSLGHFTVHRLEVATGDHVEWAPPPHTIASEPLFVPAPGGADELDGVLIVPSIHLKQNASSLIFVDPRTMKTVGMARNPIMVNFGLHNLFVPTEQNYSIRC
eukprot:TRINITY_DN29600_c0_g1_i1.p1 TRINITY_DN29600_c0_g1~~TRINITY_DN29600_c0_g1_i1.p1  ORF type:complete len:522 (+),score=120.45 TRINITY_DN29600_c0_g1_i1:49-1614(+)